MLAGLAVYGIASLFAGDEEAEVAARKVTSVYDLDPRQDLHSFTCPITQEKIREPATTVNGHLFEHRAIAQWVSQRGKCPMTKQPLREDQIVVVDNVRGAIAAARRLSDQNAAQMRNRIQELEGKRKR